MTNTYLHIIEQFWKGLGIVTTSITVDTVGEDVNIRVETPDSAILIGMHGKNIESLQHLLSRMIERQTDQFVHVHLEVNDYIKQKDEKLLRFIDSKIAIVQSTGTTIRLPSMTPYERKKAHNYIASKQIPGLSTQSEGEGAERALMLSYTGAISPRGVVTHIVASSQSQKSHISDEGTGI